jgi:hypothetical protein
VTGAPDFAALERGLFDACAAAIRSFAREQDPVEPVSAFAVDASPYYGKYHPSFAAADDDPDEVGDWTHHMYGEFDFDVSEFVDSDEYARRNAPAAAGEEDDGWIEAQARPLLARVCDRLVDGGHFAPLAVTSPFRVGYCYPSGPTVICRTL